MSSTVRAGPSPKDTLLRRGVLAGATGIGYAIAGIPLTPLTAVAGLSAATLARERIVKSGDSYALQTVDHGVVVGYDGDRPVETAKNGVRRVGTHSKYGLGEFRVWPADAARVRAEIGTAESNADRRYRSES